MPNPSAFQLVIFAVAWAAAIYVINCLIARKIKRVEISQALLHVSAMAMLGIIGETFIGSLYHFLFDKPLWNYTIAPIHHAYTSQYAIILWGIYGLHLYLLHGTLNVKRNLGIHRLALIFCIEAIVIEFLVNLTYKMSFGEYIFYYFPSDLWHLTSVQTLPFYFVACYIIIYTFKKFESDAKFFTLMSLGIIWTLAFLA